MINYIIPTVDIENSKPVFVRNGSTVEYRKESIDELLRMMSIFPRIQIIDIDAARNDGDNYEKIKPFLAHYGIFVGGGFRTKEKVIDALNNSACRVIISTNATSEFFEELKANNVQPDRLILGLDITTSFDGYFTNGRKEFIKCDVREHILMCSHYINKICVTFHDHEGTNICPSMGIVDTLKNIIPDRVKLIVAGGISEPLFVHELAKRGIYSQVGFSYEKLPELFTGLYLGSERLIPTVITNNYGNFETLAHSTFESIIKTIKTKELYLFSKSRNELWHKGETSGNYQKVTEIAFTCAGESLVIHVDNTNPICHTNKEKCFSSHPRYGKDNLYYIKNELMQQISKNPNSYSAKMINSNACALKLLEEVKEFIRSDNYEDKIHESADLLYFFVLNIIKNNVNIEDIFDEHRKRYYKVLQTHPPKVQQSKPKIGISNNKKDPIFISSVLEQYNLTELDTIVLHPRDIGTMLVNGIISEAVCFNDVLEEDCINYIPNPRSRVQPYKYATICVIGKQGFNFNENRAYHVGTEYIKISEQYFKKNHIKVKLVELHGQVENLLINDVFDCVVTIVQTGSTIKKLNLNIVSNIFDVMCGNFILVR